MTPATAPALRRELEPTHPCIRCGRPGVPADAGLCELCNPLELAQPSATQMHGIAVVGILAFIAVLAVLARVALVGTGPFAGQVTNVLPASGGLFVTLAVANEGSNASDDLPDQRVRPEVRRDPRGGADATDRGRRDDHRDDTGHALRPGAAGPHGLVRHPVSGTQ